MPPAHRPRYPGETASEPPRFPRGRRVRAWIIAGLVVLLLGGVLVYAAFNPGDPPHLRRALAELDKRDPGWRLDDIEKARAVVPEEENGGAVVLAVGALLPRSDFPPQAVENLLRDVPQEKQLSQPQLAAVTDLLASLAPATEQARLLADRPLGRLPLEFRQPIFDTQLKHQLDAKLTARLLHFDVLRHVQADDPASALRSIRAILHAAAMLSDEPGLVSQVMRMHCAMIGTLTLERALAQTAPPVADLRILEASLSREEVFNGLKIGFRGERAVGFLMMDEVATGKFASELVNIGPFRWWKVRGEIPFLLDIMTRRLEACDLPLHEQHLADAAADADANALPESAVATRLLLPAIAKVSQAHVRKVAELRFARVACAAERHRQEKGTWPASLAELVAGKYLGELPLDPNDGLPLRLKELPTGLIVYSVGADRTDDGGNIDRISLDRNWPTRAGTNLGFQLWNPELRRQPPDPPPPPAER